ncbi:Crp/Fnr family transcriptional regulator [Jiella sonneratiae]|uniref:Crp/Fnr family transcriptional regulator n=1 Tax=Jiella sonneratiae TaxID=2816856 RepID=A0ABS3J366_9HYPH|nr:Crp/Fnr family transcriptional regulator [Jiella sonneratiae]MBO0903026.1 Crp/Fnr family transcriptional regulator [Jiella sonneratiae]
MMKLGDSSLFAVHAPLRAAFGKTIEYRRKASFVRQGEPARHILFMVAGIGVRSKTTFDGSRQIVGIVTAGQFCNLSSLVHALPDHSIEAVTDCEVALTSKAELATLMREDPGLGNFVLATAIAATAAASEWVLNVGRRPASQRIAHLLCEIFVCNRDLNRTDSCSFPLTQEQLADATGLSVVQVNRSLQDLRSRGRIALRQRVLTIRDFDMLAEEADFDPSYLHGHCEHPVVSRRLPDRPLAMSL